jgi:hypothetical protein
MLTRQEAIQGDWTERSQDRRRQCPPAHKRPHGPGPSPSAARPWPRSGQEAASAATSAHLHNDLHRGHMPLCPALVPLDASPHTGVHALTLAPRRGPAWPRASSPAPAHRLARPHTPTLVPRRGPARFSSALECLRKYESSDGLHLPSLLKDWDFSLGKRFQAKVPHEFSS